MRLVAYLRVSTDAQVDGFGLAVQRQSITDWATTNGHDITTWCEDVITGTREALDREGLSCAFQALADGEASGLIVARLDRLSRTYHVQEAIFAAIWRDGHDVFSADTGEVKRNDPDDPMRTGMRLMIGVFAEIDRMMTVKRLRDGRRAKVRAGGKGSGSYPYGQCKAGPVDAELAVLADISDLRTQGRTWREVADALNAAGIPPRHAAIWSDASVRKVAKQCK
jgi:DNA invertase Pin-like site-specific DNA recombinase